MEIGHTRPDFEDFFLMWDSVLFYPNPMAKENEILLAGHSGDNGVIPCHQHRACKSCVKAETRFPPRVCPHCGKDTQHEFNALSDDEKRELEIAIMNLSGRG